MIIWGKTVKSACCFNYLLYARITEFNNPACFDIYQMIMLSALVCFFKLSNIFSELVLDDKVTVEKEFNCIVKGCTADPVIFIFHKNIESLDIKMTIP